MQQKQQPANFDLLAVFPDEALAATVTARLHKEGFNEHEVHQITQNSLGTGEFREHGPNSSRSDFFLQTRRSGPRPLIVLLSALIFALLFTGITFGATFAIALPEPATLLIAAAIGLVFGIIVGLLQRGRLRGAIGQTTPQTLPPKQLQGARTVVALRFDDPENISRKSRARAILLNNKGKIDRSVGRTE